MIIKIPEIISDGAEIAKDVRLNIASRTQYRLKCIVTKGDNVRKVDVAITSVKGSVNVTGLSFDLTGVNMISKTPLRLSSQINIFNKRINLSGTVGSKRINEELTSLEGVKKLLLELSHEF